ncbi:MAG: DNA-processing protein DprA [Chloroflexota bacterium]|nr:DNA-processing protein DprA [Chloroflexota bacterium]
MSRYREAAYWLAALNAEGVGRRVAKKAIHHWCVEQGRALSTLFTQEATELAAQCPIDTQQVARLLLAERDVPAKEKLLQELQEDEKIGVVIPVDAAYPESLIQRLPEEWLPHFLFYRGDLSILTEPALAVVGAENPSSKAQDVTEALFERLAQEGYPIISGYSSGIERRAVDTVRREGGAATILLPMGIQPFNGYVDEIRREPEASRLLVLSPYLPNAGYNETRARAREVLVAALSEATFLMAPDRSPREWSWLERFQERGGRLFIWDDGGDIVDAWKKADAVPFREVAEAMDLSRDLFGATPGGADKVLEDEKLADMDPIEFIDADSAIEVLSQSGQVPDILAQRLRDAEWPEPQIHDDDF